MSWSPQQETAIVWKQIPYSVYEASSDGRIRNMKNGKEQSPQMGADGYLFVGVRMLDTKKSVKVHKLVCMAFNGLKPAGAQCVRHLDGDKINNIPQNLRWGTLAENSADTILHGRQVFGFDHPNVHISKGEAMAIRLEYLKHMQGRKKAANGFILSLSDRYKSLGYKCVYKAASGRYDHLLKDELLEAGL